MVARRDPEIFQEIVDVILEGNFSKGWGYSSGKSNTEGVHPVLKSLPKSNFSFSKRLGK